MTTESSGHAHTQLQQREEAEQAKDLEQELACQTKVRCCDLVFACCRVYCMHGQAGLGGWGGIARKCLAGGSVGGKAMPEARGRGRGLCPRQGAGAGSVISPHASQAGCTMMSLMVGVLGSWVQGPMSFRRWSRPPGAAWSYAPARALRRM